MYDINMISTRLISNLKKKLQNFRTMNSMSMTTAVNKKTAVFIDHHFTSKRKTKTCTVRFGALHLDKTSKGLSITK